MRFLMLLFLIVHSGFCAAQNKSGIVDFSRIAVEIKPLLESKEIFGKGSYDFELKAKTDSIYLDAVGMAFNYVALNGKKIEYSNSGKRIGFKAPKRLGVHQLLLQYVTKPKQTVYFITGDSIKLSSQIWTQGQGKYTSHWLPSFDDMTEKIELDLTVFTAEAHMVIANGELKDRINEKGISEWKFDMQNPMSSYLAAFAIGNFNKRTLKSDSGVPLEMYYEPKDSLNVEPTYRYTKEIFDFLETEIGVAYPWQNYKQVPVQDFLYAGMENTGTTIFSNAYVVDSTTFIDKNYINVNAHELAHQWFGNLVTEKNASHHWLHEGFATYYAYLAEQYLLGDEHFYWKLYETAKTLRNVSESGGGEALDNPNANSLTFYEKGAWALVMLKDRIGKKAFDAGIKTYLNKYRFKNVSISDFLEEMEVAASQSLKSFKETWLESERFPWEEVKEKLKKESKSLRTVFEIEQKGLKLKNDNLDIVDYWDKATSSNFKQYLIRKYHRTLPEAVLRKAFLSNDIKIRQALSSTLLSSSASSELSKDFISEYEGLLADRSYVTVENALVKLWSNTPNKRSIYLEKTKGLIGMPNKNIRLLWLTLAMITPKFDLALKKEYYEELNGYTHPYHHFEIRQLAFQYLSQIHALDDSSLVNLLKATEHHVWQFKKFSRNLLIELSESKELKERLLRSLDSFRDDEKKAFKKLIDQ